MASRKTIVGISILGHAALFTGVFFHSAWDVDQLGNESRSRATVAALAPPAAEGGSVDLPKVDLRRKEPPKTPVTGPRQPTPKREDPPAIPTTGTGGDGTTGTGRIGPPGDTDGPCRPEDGPCDETKPPEPQQPKPEPPKPPVAPPKQPEIVPPQTLKRTKGDTAIHPPRDVYQQMARDRELKTSGILKVCISATGAVTSVSVLKSTGYKAYDAALVDGARDWLYRPYITHGVAMPACTSVTFQYQMR